MTIETPEDYLSSRSHKRPADSPPVQPPLPPARRQGVFTQLHLEAVRGPTVEPEISTGLPELAPNISMNTLERCWVCHKTKGLKLAHLLSTNINSRYRFCYFRNMKLVTFNRCEDARNVVTLCPQCHMDFESEPPGFIIVPNSLSFLIRFEEADYQRRAYTGGPRTVPTAAEYAPREYRVVHLVDYTESYVKAIRAPMCWGGEPTAMVLRSAGGIMYPSPQVPDGMRRLFARLVELYSRTEQPVNPHLPRDLAYAGASPPSSLTLAPLVMNDGLKGVKSKTQEPAVQGDDLVGAESLGYVFSSL